MEQRSLRLGDLVDDYCPRDRRVTNHVIVVIADDAIRQTRCQTCDAEHEYKEAKVPRKKLKNGEASDLAGGVLVPEGRARQWRCRRRRPHARLGRSGVRTARQCIDRRRTQRRQRDHARRLAGASAADSRDIAEDRKRRAATASHSRIHDASAPGPQFWRTWRRIPARSSRPQRRPRAAQPGNERRWRGQRARRQSPWWRRPAAASHGIVAAAEGSFPLSQLFAGKTGLVVGVANKRSLSWAIAEATAAEGASLVLTYQGERLEENVRELAADVSDPLILPCDVTNEAQLDAVFAEIDRKHGGLDFLVHGVAFADREDLARPFSETSREGFARAMDISVYSLLSLARRAAPLMDKRGGGSILTLSYLGADRVFTNYNVMGVAKAALESSVRYLASELGPRNDPRQRDFRRSGENARGVGHLRLFIDPADLPRSRAVAAHRRRQRRRRRRAVPARPRRQRRHRRNPDGRRRIPRDGRLTRNSDSSNSDFSL